MICRARKRCIIKVHVVLRTGIIRIHKSLICNGLHIINNVNILTVDGKGVSKLIVGRNRIFQFVSVDEA
jgi:hypothetical protein